MVTRRLTELLLAFAILPMLVQPALAHSMYFGSKGEDIPLLFGHPEEGEDEVLPYDPADIEELTAYDLTGAVVPSEIKNFGDSISVIPNEDIAALTAFVNRGFYVVTPDGEYLNISKREATEYTEAFRSFHYPKSLFNWSDAISQPLGLQLEIVSLQNPYKVMAGEDLDVQVLFEGAPRNDVLVEYLGKTVEDVNKDGIFSIPLRQEGLQTIEASYSIPLENNPDTDALSYSASLSIQPIPESDAWVGIGAFGLLAFIAKSRLKKSSHGVLIRK